jgi:hypothetical protein
MVLIDEQVGQRYYTFTFSPEKILYVVVVLVLAKKKFCNHFLWFNCM